MKILYWFAPVYTLVICYGSLTDRKVTTVAISNIDKVMHAGAYAIMFILWYLFFYHRYLERQVHFEYNLQTILSSWSRTIAIAAGIFSLLIGGFIEVGQHLFSERRQMDGWDLLANGAGIVLAMFIIYYLPRLFYRR
jgi:VanZ family protein